MPVQELIPATITTQFRLGMEPALNALQSLVLLTGEKIENRPGLHEWILNTREALSREEQHTHDLVMIGFHFAILPRRSWSSFPAYLDHLATMDAVELREKMMEAYSKVSLCKPGRGESNVEAPPALTSKEAALASPEAYLAFLGEHFSSEHIDVELETQAYQYVSDPPAMQKFIVSHLRHMWENYLAQEWERVTPMLEDCVRAFREIDFKGMGRGEIAQFISGHDFSDDIHVDKIENAEQLIFVPNAHLGPYFGGYEIGKNIYLLFGARPPQGAELYAPDLSRNEILVRMSALADDSRLRILKLIAERGELRSQDIMEQLELSQSASSRHLTQLSATGFLIERRCNGAKCYDLNPQRIEDTLKAVNNFLLGS